MDLKDVKKFLTECVEKGVEVPRDLTIAIKDFAEEVPSEYHNLIRVELNHRVGKGDREDKVVTVNLVAMPKYME